MKKSEEDKKRAAASDKSNFPSCNACHKHVSASTAVTSEGKDYIRHFCSQACFNKWQKKKSS